MKLPTKYKEDKSNSKKAKSNKKTIIDNTEWLRLLNKSYRNSTCIGIEKVYTNIGRIRVGMVDSAVLESVEICDTSIKLQYSWDELELMLIVFSYSRFGNKTMDILIDNKVRGINIDVNQWDKVGNHRIRQYKFQDKVIAVPTDSADIIENIAKLMYINRIRQNDIHMYIRSKEKVKDKEFWQDRVAEIDENMQNAVMLRLMIEKEKCTNV